MEKVKCKDRQCNWSHMQDNVISLARLDWFCFKHHYNIFKGCLIMPVGFTDHSLVLCKVFIQNAFPKSPYWHFNNSLTFDKSFEDALSFMWSVFKTRKLEFSSLRQWWDCGKTKIKNLCQQHTLNVIRVIT